MGLEIQSKLCLHLAVQRGLRIGASDQTEVRAIDVHDEVRAGPSRHRAGLGMVEYILCVQTDLQALGLRDLERLRHACVSAPLPRSFHHPLAQGTPLSGKRILKKNLAGLGKSLYCAMTRASGTV